METFVNKNKPKTSHKYYCEICEYGTSKTSNISSHNATSKHVRLTYINEYKPNSSHNFLCSNCDKEFMSRVGLWKHKKKCMNENICKNEHNDIILDKEFICKLINDNQELKQLLGEQSKTMQELGKTVQEQNKTNQEQTKQIIELSKEKTITNNIHNTNSHNKTFNLQFYLNETCKNAINMSDFVKNIKMELEDLETTGRYGYVEGISNIFLKNLKTMKNDDMPLHCTDLKREIIYIKDNDTWEKEDEDKKHFKKAICQVAHQNIKQIGEWKKLYPDCCDSESKKNNTYLNIVGNAMAGSTDDEIHKNIKKIVSNITKEVVIHK